jgi:topoisomerase-4 subunit A
METPARSTSYSGKGDDAAPIERHAAQAYLGTPFDVKARACPRSPTAEAGAAPDPVRDGDASTQGFAKCARYVGEVLGKYHPHGDSSTYEALVHLAQPFSMRYPLIDGQGNFGSRDGDSAAAYRYTEAKLSRYAELMLAEIGEGTVDFIKNYDGKFEEPVLLPARVPFGLLNGSFGIPVGFSTRIPPHNLKEVAHAAAHVIRIRAPSSTTCSTLLPGPDFPRRRPDHFAAEESRTPTRPAAARSRCARAGRPRRSRAASGASSITSCRTACRAGRCSRRSRRSPIPSRAGKKEGHAGAAAPEAVRARPGRDGARRVRPQVRLRLVIEPRSSRQDAGRDDEGAARAHSLETRMPVNLTWLGLDGLPETKGIVDVLREWGEFRVNTVRRRTQHRLTSARSACTSCWAG